MRKGGTRFFLIVGVCIAWSLYSLAPIWKYLSYTRAAIATLVALSSIGIGMHLLARFNRRRLQIGLGWFILVYLVFVAAFAVLYPLSLKRTLNQRSDREDALRIELVAIRHHKYPYDARTFLGNPPTPLPGALLLATPFFLVKHIAWQNFLWIAAFFYFAIRFFRFRSTALFFVLIFLLLSPSSLSDLTSGGDYLTNFFYISIAAGFLVHSLDKSLHQAVSAASFVGLTLSSRSLYLVILIPLFALLLGRTTRTRVVLLFGVILATATALTLPVFTPHLITHLHSHISQNAGKLLYMPTAIHAERTLPALALLVSCLSFFIKMDIRRLFLIFSGCSAVVLVPPVLAKGIHMHKLPYECSYLSISALSFCLWALSRYEDSSSPALTSGQNNLVTID